MNELHRDVSAPPTPLPFNAHQRASADARHNLSANAAERPSASDQPEGVHPRERASIIEYHRTSADARHNLSANAPECSPFSDQPEGVHPREWALDEAIRRVTAALDCLRVAAQPEEAELHVAIAAALTRAGIAFQHEFRLAPRCRIDFLAGRIGIEVKKGRPAPATLRAQIARYLANEALDAVIVVAQRTVPLPRAIGKKPVTLVAIDRLWGIALP